MIDIKKRIFFLGLKETLNYAEFQYFCIRVTKVESALGKISDNFLR